MNEHYNIIPDRPASFTSDYTGCTNCTDYKGVQRGTRYDPEARLKYLWDSFKSLQKSQGGMDTREWQQREETKLLIENGSV